jgi:hypothetical protein
MDTPFLEAMVQEAEVEAMVQEAEVDAGGRLDGSTLNPKPQTLNPEP